MTFGATAIGASAGLTKARTRDSIPERRTTMERKPEEVHVKPEGDDLELSEEELNNVAGGFGASLMAGINISKICEDVAKATVELAAKQKS
jgi:hypothetical protein